LQDSGNGIQSVYLTELPMPFADVLIGLIGKEAELMNDRAARSTLQTDVLQLSGLPAGDVKESRNDSSTCDLQMAADRTRPHTLCGPVVSSLFSFATRC